jgi:hypothetical protein
VQLKRCRWHTAFLHAGISIYSVYGQVSDNAADDSERMMGDAVTVALQMVARGWTLQVGEWGLMGLGLGLGLLLLLGGSISCC